MQNVSTFGNHFPKHLIGNKSNIFELHNDNTSHIKCAEKFAKFMIFDTNVGQRIRKCHKTLFFLNYVIKNVFNCFSAVMQETRKDKHDFGWRSFQRDFTYPIRAALHHQLQSFQKYPSWWISTRLWLQKVVFSLVFFGMRPVKNLTIQFFWTLTEKIHNKYIIFWIVFYGSRKYLCMEVHNCVSTTFFFYRHTAESQTIPPPAVRPAVRKSL